MMHRAAATDAALSRFPEAWAMDFEFTAHDGERPIPLCVTAIELHSGRKVFAWVQPEPGQQPAPPPFVFAHGAVVLAYLASAELNCLLELGWPLPDFTLDLYAEFRRYANGLADVAGFSLVAALEHFGLPAIDAAYKDTMRELAMRGGIYSAAERAALIRYCWGDTLALGGLAKRLLPMLDGPHALEHALIRGRFMIAGAHMERTGIPIDVEMLRRMQGALPQVKGTVAQEVSSHYRVEVEGRVVEPYVSGSFRAEHFRAWLEAHDIPWPESETPGAGLALDTDTFELMTKRHPELKLLHDARKLMGSLRPLALKVGADGRNRALLSPFRSITTRNQPSNADAIFGAPRWIRPLIKPAPGRFVAYCDFASQEVAIAARLSGDEALWAAYESGDVYLAFGQAAGLIPPEGTKATHKAQRDICKVLVLGTGYGMQAETFARKAVIHIETARKLLQLHRDTYRTFWGWSDAQVEAAHAGTPLHSVFGARLWMRGRDYSVNTLRNWAMQTNGADMMRCAAILLTEAGIEVCAPVHDAFLIEGPIERRDDITARTIELMGQASEFVLGAGHRCRVDVEKLVQWPEAFDVPPPLRPGERPTMWHIVQDQIERLEARHAGAV